MADAFGLGSRIRKIVSRRRFFQWSLLLAALGVGRRADAQASRALRYRPLARPVLVPAADLSASGRARQFVADAVTLPSAATPNQPIRITGMIARTSADISTGLPADRFSAVCVRCPHELCDVDFVADSSTLAQEIVDEIGHPVREPVYVCPCHNSTFRMDDGERLAGPAPRGLYRFRVTGVTETAVEIGEVEEDVLVFV